MRIIISPAKKMRWDPDSLPWRELPQFLPRTEQIYSVLKEMSREELKKLWKCNDEIASLNVERLASMELRSNLTPAILAYEGIQYRYMAPGVFSDREFDYIQEHLRILSGFYGILKPFDGVTPYRLEMQAKLKLLDKKNLYDFWGDVLARCIQSETDCIINLASKEYSIAISKYITPQVPFITCIFGEEKNGKLVEKGTLCKMARGEMVRFMAENQIRSPEEIRNFNRLNFRFDPSRSDSNTFAFVLQEGADKYD